MRHSDGVSRFALSFALILLAGPAWAQQATPGDIVPGELLVKLAPGATLASAIDGAGLSQAANLQAADVLSDRLRIWKLAFDAEIVPAAVALQAVRQSPGIAVAQFNHYVELRGGPERPGDKRPHRRIDRQCTSPDDPKFDQQWALHNASLSPPEAVDADIDAPGAWGVETDGTTAAGDQVVIAVIDGGFDLGHWDFQFWKNADEVPNNGLDDDGNGYVDDYEGWNAANSSGNIPTGDHGTRVAGIAAADTDNGRGIAGVIWDARIMPISLHTGSVDQDVAMVIEAYDYALDQRIAYEQSGGAEGAFVVVTNNSFGISYAADPADYPLWCNMYNELGQHGILNAAAAPNKSVDVDQVGDVPTACPSDYLITATNTTDTDDLNSGAAWGDTHIDLGAPGTDILSTVPNNGYLTRTGTSFATPHVTGTVALLVSALNSTDLQTYKSNPASFALELKQYIMSSAEPISALEGKTVTGGRLNAGMALAQVDPPEPPPEELFVDVSGDNSLYEGEFGTWTATVSNGTAPFTYKWYYADWSSDNWTLVHSITRPERQDFYSRQMENSGFHLRVNVTGAGGQSYTYLRHTVVYDESGGDDCPWYDPCDCPPGQICEASTDSTLTYGLGAALPEEFSLQGNAPNPFSDRTEIRFALPEAARVTLVVYDMQGRVVMRLVNRKLKAGYHTAPVDASDLASGVYLYRMTAGDKFADTGRMVVVK